jgi:predicted metal-dependent phosphoesterase TrpH
VPGYEPFLLCDFHVHTRWSDGRLSVREVVDLYGRTGRFDVIAITDHILMKRDLLGRAARLATLGRCEFSVTPERFDAYLEDIAAEARRAKQLYGMLVIPGAEITQNHIRSKKNSHIVALNIREHISADQPAEDILKEIRRQDALSIACHPHHRTTTRLEIGTCYLWEHRRRVAELVDVWEAGNRDDLFSVTSLKHYPYVANSDFHKPKHLYSWKTLLRCEKEWEAIARTLRANVDIAVTLFRNGSWAA